MCSCDLQGVLRELVLSLCLLQLALEIEAFTSITALVPDKRHFSTNRALLYPRNASAFVSKDGFFVLADGATTVGPVMPPVLGAVRGAFLLL